MAEKSLICTLKCRFIYKHFYTVKFLPWYEKIKLQKLPFPLFLWVFVCMSFTWACLIVWFIYWIFLKNTKKNSHTHSLNFFFPSCLCAALLKCAFGRKTFVAWNAEYIATSAWQTECECTCEECESSKTVDIRLFTLFFTRECFFSD